jgi:hypothetical protein
MFRRIFWLILLLPNISWCASPYPTPTGNILNDGEFKFGVPPWSDYQNVGHELSENAARSPLYSEKFWYNSGVFQVVTGVAGGQQFNFGGYLYTPNSDALRNGIKYGKIFVQTYNHDGLIVQYEECSPIIYSGSTTNLWITSTANVILSAGVEQVRYQIELNYDQYGDGVFFADDAWMVENLTPTPTATTTNTPSATPVDTTTFTATPTLTATPTTTNTAIDTATCTQTPLPTFTATQSPVLTVTPTSTPIMRQRGFKPLFKKGWW